MCHFVSWKEIEIEGKKELFYLTYDNIYNSKRGTELQKYTNSEDVFISHGASEEDFIGHGAIDFYYELKGRGVNRECTDFSTPDNFPDEIVDCIKSGKFYHAIELTLLNVKGREKYDKIENDAYEEYNKIEKTARKEYEKIAQDTWKEYQKVVQDTWKEYQKVEKDAWDEYVKITNPAWEEYDKIEKTARKEYVKITNPARKEYDKIRQEKFWELFKNTKYRNEAWV